MKVTLPISVLVKLIPVGFAILRNYVLRPKIKLRVEHRHIKFSFIGGEERIVEIPYIALYNQTKKSISINAKKVYINSESYPSLIQGDNVFLSYYNSKNACFSKCKVDLVYKFYSENWFEMSQGAACLIVPPKEEILFPLKLIGVGILLLNRSKKKSILLFSRNKISFTAQLDGRLYEYGLSRKTVRSTYNEYLASYTAKYDSQRCL